jgi:hypothetical protein
MTSGFEDNVADLDEILPVGRNGGCGILAKIFSELGKYLGEDEVLDWIEPIQLAESDL